MTINNYFNIQRFLLTLKNDLIRNAKTYLISLGAIAGIFFTIDVLPGILTGNTFIMVPAYLPLYMVLGYILSSIIFNEMHDSQKGLVFLTTPSSTLEKLISKLLITTIIYTGIMWSFFHILTLFLNTTNALFFGSEAVSFAFNWELVRIYVITQALYLFASSYFKKNAFLKLLFAAFLLQMFFSFFSVINFKLFFNISDFNNIHFETMDINMGDIADYIKNIVYISKFSFYWLFAPFLWFMTYLRIAEKEV